MTLVPVVVQMVRTFACEAENLDSTSSQRDHLRPVAKTERRESAKLLYVGAHPTRTSFAVVAQMDSQHPAFTRGVVGSYPTDGTNDAPQALIVKHFALTKGNVGQYHGGAPFQPSRLRAGSDPLKIVDAGSTPASASSSVWPSLIGRTLDSESRESWSESRGHNQISARSLATKAAVLHADDRRFESYRADQHSGDGPGARGSLQELLREFDSRHLHQERWSRCCN